MHVDTRETVIGEETFFQFLKQFQVKTSNPLISVLVIKHIVFLGIL